MIPHAAPAGAKLSCSKLPCLIDALELGELDKVITPVVVSQSCEKDGQR
jgi:hypothetical protein